LGLGLTIVKRTVELHAGRIEARSEKVEKGSEFLVWLPLLKQVRTAADEKPFKERGAGGQSVRQWIGPEWILSDAWAVADPAPTGGDLNGGVRCVMVIDALLREIVVKGRS